MTKALIFGAALALMSFAVIATPAAADPLADIQAFTLNDVKAAESVYAANPSVPTYGAATQCLGYLDTTLSQANAVTADVTFAGLAQPQGVASTVADLDVTLNGPGIQPIVFAFNSACGGYIEDLKAEAAKTVGQNFNLFGVIKF